MTTDWRAPAGGGVVICPPDHKHAQTTTCYDRHRCRCAPCSDNYRAYQRRISRLGTDGKRVAGYVDAEPARQHIVAALDAGVSFADAVEGLVTVEGDKIRFGVGVVKAYEPGKWFKREARKS